MLTPEEFAAFPNQEVDHPEAQTILMNYAMIMEKKKEGSKELAEFLGMKVASYTGFIGRAISPEIDRQEESLLMVYWPHVHRIQQDPALSELYNQSLKETFRRMGVIKRKARLMHEEGLY